MNADELLEMNPYKEVAQQGHAPPLSPAYVPDPMELDEHVPIYVSKPEHPKYHVPSDDDMQPSDDDNDDDTDDEDEEPTEDEDDEEEEEEHLALANSSTTCLRRARNIVRLEPPMSASMEACIAEHVIPPIPPTSPAYDQAPLEESFAVAVARPPRGQYDFVDTVEAGQGLIYSPGHDAQTIARAADTIEDVGYVRALQVSEHRMMNSIEEVNLRIGYQAQVRRQESEDFYTQLHDARTECRDIRLKIDIVRGQWTAYETELHEVRDSLQSM
uniref:Uncharacterized protein n=1 Tax=Tanacetum cinerariifolium TaxID=118510 RepID=A0A699KXS3_TANCI|nr:hypothetical protein [Tanacetum cinerariifolium]